MAACVQDGRFRSRSVASLLVAAVFFVVAGAGSRSAWASEEGGGPSVLLIRTADRARNARLEKQFLSELGLVLDDFRVVVTSRPTKDFADLSLTRQVPVIRRLLGRTGAVAAVWLGYGANDLLLLNLVSVSTGRALVRIVESRAQLGAASKLALAARELLGTAYMFRDAPAPRTKALAKVVRTVRRHVALPVQRPGREISIGAVGLLQAGIYGQSASRIESGGGIRVDLHLVRGLWGRALFSGMVTDLGRTATRGDVFGWRAAVGLGLMYGWRFGAWSLGPTLGVEMGASYTRLTLHGGISATNSAMYWRVPLGFEVRWEAARYLRVFAGIDLGFRPRQEEFVLASDGSSVLASPWLDGGFVLGVAFSTVP